MKLRYVQRGGAGEARGGSLAERQPRKGIPPIVHHFPTFLHEVRLQQAADLLQEAGVLRRGRLLSLRLNVPVCTLECDLEGARGWMG